MKLISILVPCYNEEKNIHLMCEKIDHLFSHKLTQYDYELIFIDNKSIDATRKIIREECKKKPKVKALFNAKNYSYESGGYGIRQTHGACTIFIPADFQVPIEIIPDFVKKWEEGAKIVCAVKQSSEEKSIMWGWRRLFNIIVSKLSDKMYIPHYDGSGLYDAEFIKVFKEVCKKKISLIKAVSYYGWDIALVYFKQPVRKSGKSKNKLKNLIDIGLSRFINNATHCLRVFLFIGGMVIFIAFLAFIGGGIYAVSTNRLTYFLITLFCSVVLLLFGLLFIGIGILGEYIGNLRESFCYVSDIVVEETINFDKKENETCKS